MKTNNILSIVIVGLLSTLPFCMQAQIRDAMSKGEISKMDSLELATLQTEQLQKTSDENRMKKAKLERKQARAKSKDARRVEKEASDAVRQSKASVRMERKAQKARNQATKQEKRALAAKDKSDKN